jgi:6-phosphogluconolactonase
MKCFPAEAFFVYIRLMKITFLKSSILTVLFSMTMNAFSQDHGGRYHYLLIGTYTKTQNKGIFVYKFDTKTGKLSLASNTEGIKNPSFLTLNNNATKLYSVSEGTTGQVSAFDFDNKTGKLTLINSQETKSAGPCHVTLTADNKFLISANYSGGSLSVFPVLNDGSLAPLTQLVQHVGSSIDPKGRQKSAHAHSSVNSPDGTHVYAADLGADKIFGYEYVPTAVEPLKAAEQAFVKTEPGSGPRHFTFNKRGDLIYSVEELSGTVAVYTYKNKTLTEIQRVNMNTADFNGVNGAADIHLSNDGKFLYATNRGTADEIVIFSVDNKSGKIERIGSQSTMGKHPRNFAIDPSDKFLLIANQNTDNIFVFSRNTKTGLLKYTGESLSLGAPVCLKFTPVK